MSSYKELNRSEKRVIDQILDMEEGYVLDFSNRTIEEFFEDEFGIQFYDQRYSINGDSKAKRLRTILGSHQGSQASQILKTLWEYRTTLPLYQGQQNAASEEALKNAYLGIVSKLKGTTNTFDKSAFQAFEKSDTLHELLASIERDMRDDAPQAAIDRLHLFCVKRFSNLLEKRGQTPNHSEPLNSLVGRYCKELESEQRISDMSRSFIKYSIAVFEKFNDVRNNRSLAHDNQLLEAREAKFIFEAVGAVLKFIKGIDGDFGS